MLYIEKEDTILKVKDVIDFTYSIQQNHLEITTIRNSSYPSFLEGLKSAEIKIKTLFSDKLLKFIDDYYDKLIFTFEMEDFKYQFEGFIKDYEAYRDYQDQSETFMELMVVCTSSCYFSIKDQRHISDMSIFEIMEHVHQRLQLKGR